MPPTDVSERWQNKVNSLKDGIQKIHENKEFCDVVFIVGRKKFKAHRLILASRSSEFARLLLVPNPIDEITVEDECVTETGFDILLCFIYTDDLGTDDKQSIVKAYLAADFYKQKKLMQRCEELIDTWSISVDEVCELLNVSLGIPKLKEKCLTFITINADDVISSPTFLSLNNRAVVAILENDALKDIEVKRRIQKIVEWGAHMHTSPVDYALVRDDFLNNSPPILALLKIEELTYDELGELFTDAYENLLTSVETCKFMKYKRTNNRDDLPTWYNSA